MAANGDPEAVSGDGTAPEAEADAVESEILTPVNTARLILSTIALEAGTKLVTAAIDKMVLGVPTDAEAAQAARAKPGKIRKFSAGKLAKIATKSKPGAIAVAGGLFAKHVFDRGGKRRQARREAHKASQK